MKKGVALLCILSMILIPTALYADEASQGVSQSGGRPVQFITKKGPPFFREEYVDNTNAVKEPAGVDWSTGRGRKDFILKWAVDDNYLKKVPGMLLRGLSNVAFGWVEILTQPFRWNRNSPAGIGLATGVIMGPTMFILRTGSGVIDIVTCWVPWWYGVPLKKQVLGIHEVAHYGTIEDVDDYDHKTKRFFFDWLKEDY